MGSPFVPEHAAAKAAGERFYFTGKPCANGHISKRYTHNGCCSVCQINKTMRFQAKGVLHPAQKVAREAGLRHFDTGEPCQNGHIGLRYVSSGYCIECRKGCHNRFHAARPGEEARWARERRAKDPTRHRAEAMRWYVKNKAAAREIALRWKRNNPERARYLSRIGVNNRRTRKAANGGRFTIGDIEKLFETQKGCCAGCDIEDVRLEIDHVMPILLGGSSNPDNLQLLCFPCNRSKGAKHPDVWRKSLKPHEILN